MPFQQVRTLGLSDFTNKARGLRYIHIAHKLMFMQQITAHGFHISAALFKYGRCFCTRHTSAQKFMMSRAEI